MEETEEIKKYREFLGSWEKISRTIPGGLLHLKEEPEKIYNLLRDLKEHLRNHAALSLASREFPDLFPKDAKWNRPFEEP